MIESGDHVVDNDYFTHRTQFFVVSRFNIAIFVITGFLMVDVFSPSII
jgi:hypothetical protein